MRLAILVALALGVAARASSAQIDPGAKWRTLATTHFRVHFTPETERLARRAAVDAEAAYAALAAELAPPRGVVDLVVADGADYSNGFATTFPTNRLVIFAHPPLAEQSLRFTDDWIALVVTHELAHLFHLDRSRGIWRLAQRIFGRHPSLFPNQYSPRWITEGLAVHYESRITGAGRVIGSGHRMIARASLLERTGFQRLDELSLSTSRFPYGQAAYVFGSLLIDALARSGRDSGVRHFVDATSGQLVPFFIGRAARRAFGVSLQQAWFQWRDSLRRSVTAAGGPIAGWREWRGAEEYAQHPRWVNDSTLVVVVNDGRDVTRLVEVTPGGTRRLSRRNSLDVNAPDGDGFVYAQLEFLNPYEVRSDLWREGSSGTVRLTRGARLSQPDVRDGRIVAVQSMPGGSRLVTLDARGEHITQIVAGSPDTTWSEPRWSPDGAGIIASRWRRGGYAAIVLIDARTGRPDVLYESRAVNAAPAWTPDGRAVVFSSDRTGTSQLYRLEVASGVAAQPLTLSSAQTGLFEPQISPDGRRVAALLYRAGGYALGVGDLAVLAEADTTTRVAPRSGIATAGTTAVAARPYRAWRTLMPRYWEPSWQSLGDGRQLIGALTSSNDVIGRHAWIAQALYDTRERRVEGSANYQWARLRQPVLDFSASQSNDYFGVIFRRPGAPGDTARRALRRATRVVSMSASILRPRIRASTGLSAGLAYEWRSYLSNDPRLRDVGALLAPRSTTPAYPSVFLSAFFANARRPSRAVSLEDGISVTGTLRQRWLRDVGTQVTRTGIGAFRGYRSLDLPGFAHHVVALRGAVGASDRRGTSELSVGGVNGSSVEIIPTVTIGGEPRAFPVRGFLPATQYGLAAASGSLEYRAPFVSLLRGYRLLPLFFDRSALTFFGDAGSAWCPASVAGNAICTAVPGAPRWLASLGAELNLDAALLDYDSQYRMRFGIAAPVARRLESGAPTVRAYFTFGSNF